ncbi:LysR substrate-binding domain-containing protein [Pinirhizobacter soli]|uniref:LysR substrate-binding domain-containing protein n=1 Tax=Pinirhizobacter soli TaxID=2786953 RepID=UPI00202A2018|nr:LysR substrate-binding domain-containing protein [Pinirhizobacter soli]
MELRQLQHMVALAEEQHFTRAAQRVNIVQSALSTSIRQLEAELEAQLFVRSTRQVRLTAAGKLFLDKAKVALAAIADARDAVAALQGLRRGTLSIGTMQSLPAFLDLPALIEEFHTRHPEIEVRLSQGASSGLLTQVRNGRLDIAFVPVTEPAEDVATTMIACEALVVVCAPEHLLAGRVNVPLTELRTQPFVDFEPDWGTRKLVDRGFMEAGIERRIAFEVNDLETLLELVRRGMGIALLPEIVAQSRRPALGIAELAEPEICWELVVAYAAAGTPPLAIDEAPRAFLALLDEIRSV